MSAKLAVAALLAAPAVAWGFSGGNHHLYSRHAAFVASCLSPEADKAAFADGARNEDESLLTMGERASNWHYARNPAMRNFAVFPAFPLSKDVHLNLIPFPSKTNLDEIFDQRLRELHEAAAPASGECPVPAKVYEKAGRVTHHIQDMRVPVHVIPVDHGALNHSDEFDTYRFKVRPELDEKKCLALKVAAATATRADILERLGKARDDTRERIRQPIPGASKVEECKWDRVFWCHPRDNVKCPLAYYPGFGSYPPKVDPKWGQEKVSCGPHRDVEVKYDEFFRPAYKDMIEDTVFMMLYAESLIARRPDCARVSR